MKLQSRKTIDGPTRAPQRAMYKAMGLDKEDLNRPIVAVSSTCNEATPCMVIESPRQKIAFPQVAPLLGVFESRLKKFPLV